MSVVTPLRSSEPILSPSAAPEPREHGCADPGLSLHGFVALMAAIMACQALGIDSMLAALPEIGRALGVADENARQWIIAIYMFGFGAAQLVYGPLADRYGRRPILLASLCLFGAMSIVAGLSGSFAGLLVARFLQGVAGAAGRVLTVSITRDCFHGRQMARVMSLSFIVFLAVPALAPSIGQAIMLVGGWRDIFFFLAGFASLVAIAGARRLNETLHPDARQPISAGTVIAAVRRTLRERQAIGYTLAGTAVFGALMGFVNSVQQVFADTFHAPGLFPITFAAMAGAMGLSAYVNSRVVERLGTRLVSHAALAGFILISSVHLAVALAGLETAASFAVLQCLAMGCFGMTGSNFNSMAMEPMGSIAGTAASVQGFLSTVGGAAIGVVIGQSFNGTTVPLEVGFVVTGLTALALVLVTERGRLFGAQPATA